MWSRFNPELNACLIRMNVFPFGRFVCCQTLLLLCTVPLVAETPTLDTVEKSAGDWLKVRAETNRLETEWDSQRQLLDSMVHGVEARATTLEAKRDFLRAATAKDRDEMTALESANKSATSGLETVDAQLKATDARLLLVRPSLPPRLSAALELPYKSLAGSQLTVGERMQLTVTVLNRCLQFNRSIACEDEVLEVGPDRGARQLEVIYWGLSHGYALDRPAGKVWYGSPGPEGWHWEPVPEMAEKVASLIAAYHGKTDPAFVDVPVTLKKELSAPAQK